MPHGIGIGTRRTPDEFGTTGLGRKVLTMALTEFRNMHFSLQCSFIIREARQKRVVRVTRRSLANERESSCARAWKYACVVNFLTNEIGI